MPRSEPDDPLLEQFLELEDASSLARILLPEIERLRGTDVWRDYNFNLFDVRLLFDEDRAEIQDILSPPGKGETAVTMEDFVSALEDRRDAER